MKLSYQYVIYGASGFYEIAYHDLFKDDNILYYSFFNEGVKKAIPKIITRISFSSKINQLFNYPFKRYSFDRISECSFSKEGKVCFIFFTGAYLHLTSEFIVHLRCKYKRAKIILFLQDIVSSHQKFDVEQAKSDFDLVLSYDKNDTEKYGLLYHPTPYSFVPVVPRDTPTSDFYFCGQAKNRYKTIFQVYCKLRQEGYKCDFHIFQLDKRKQIIEDGLIYDEPMSYIDNLKHVVSSKCILEIQQGGAVGFTPRLWESIMYDKHLLSDNLTIKSSQFYNENTVHFIDKINDISSWINLEAHHSQQMKDSLSPYNLLAYIEERLSLYAED